MRLNQVQAICSARAYGNIHSNLFRLHRKIFLLHFASGALLNILEKNSRLWKISWKLNLIISKQLQLLFENWNKFEIITIVTCDSNASKENVFCIEPIDPVTNNFFSDTKVVLDCSPDSCNKIILPSVL